MMSAIYLVGCIGLALFYEWVLRKTAARLQGRKGPLYAGPFGVLQPLADLIKLIAKEDISHEFTDPLFNILPALSLSITILALFLIPISPAADFSVSLLLLCALLILESVTLFLAAYSASSKYSIVGGMRYASQVLVIEVPLLISLLSPAILIGSFSISDVSGWNILKLPLAFLIFLISLIVELNLLPFDMPEARSELTGGWLTEFSGKKLEILNLNHDLKLVLASFLITTIFLGGGSLLIFLIKSTSVVLIFSIIHSTFARFRIDKFVSKIWKILIPLALLQVILI